MDPPKRGVGRGRGRLLVEDEAPAEPAVRSPSPPRTGRGRGRGLFAEPGRTVGSSPVATSLRREPEANLASQFEDASLEDTGERRPTRIIRASVPEIQEPDLIQITSSGRPTRPVPVSLDDQVEERRPPRPVRPVAVPIDVPADVERTVPPVGRPAYQPSDRREPTQVLAGPSHVYGAGGFEPVQFVDPGSLSEAGEGPTYSSSTVLHNRGRSSARGSTSVFHGDRIVSGSGSSSRGANVQPQAAIPPASLPARAPVQVPAPVIQQPPPVSVEPVVTPVTPVQSIRAPLIKRGDKGEFAQMACNFLHVKYSKEGCIREYHVNFYPNLDGRKQRRRALDQYEGVLGAVRNFDGMKLFLPLRLAEDKIELVGMHPTDPSIELMTVITYIKESQAADMMLFFNLLFKKVMRTLKKVELRRAYYDLEKVVKLDQHKLEVWPGFCLAVEEREGGLMLCLDASHRVLRTETVYNHLESVRGSSEGWQDSFTDYILGKIVLTRYNNMLYKIDDVMWDANPTAVFMRTTRDGEEEISYVDYYRTQYEMKVTDLRQPLLLSKIKPRRTEADLQPPERMVALIPELCYVTGLSDDQRTNFTVMKDLGDKTRLAPADRRKALQEFASAINDNPVAKKILSDWNMELDGRPMYIQARNISGPKLNFGSRGDVAVGADFTREATSSCHEPVDIAQYLIISTQRDADKAKRFVDVYRQVAQALGIKTNGGAKMLPIKGHQVNDFRRAIKENLTAGLQFLVVIMPQQRDDIYSLIKKTCVSELGVPSQVVLTKTLSNEKRLKSVVQKIALQINCKLGGSLWALNMPIKEQIMFVGIDVCHDPKRKNPSILAMVINLDNSCTKYFSIIRVMKVHQEVSDHLESAFTEAMKDYYQVRGCYPGRIIVWRDGGSIASVEFFKTHEVGQLLKVVEAFCPTTNFSFVVIQKRIAQRFFQTDRRGERWQNPEPGTIIDHTVTSRYNYDFFVVPQMVRQGTVTPTHYVVIYDPSDTKPDLMQKFAYVTSFMYYNWSGTIRVPAMIQYAHKLAALVGQYVRAPPGRPLIRTLYYL